MEVTEGDEGRVVLNDAVVKTTVDLLCVDQCTIQAECDMFKLLLKA